MGQHCPDPQSNSLSQGLLKQKQAPEPTAAEWISAAWFYCCIDTAHPSVDHSSVCQLTRTVKLVKTESSLVASRSKGKDLLQAYGVRDP